uniref:Thioredoxin like 4A n=1 Tax=Felis catus TaxID=9685 RepID=A0ABI7VTL0_FELCA
GSLTGPTGTDSRSGKDRLLSTAAAPRENPARAAHAETTYRQRTASAQTPAPPGSGRRAQLRRTRAARRRARARSRRRARTVRRGSTPGRTAARDSLGVRGTRAALKMSYMLPHLHNGWQVDQAILSEEDRVVVIRFGHDWDPTCMKMDEVLYSIAEKEQAHHD